MRIQVKKEERKKEGSKKEQSRKEESMKEESRKEESLRMSLRTSIALAVISYVSPQTLVVF